MWTLQEHCLPLRCFVTCWGSCLSHMWSMCCHTSCSALEMETSMSERWEGISVWLYHLLHINISLYSLTVFTGWSLTNVCTPVFSPRLQMTVLKLWWGTWVPTEWSLFSPPCLWPLRRNPGELKQVWSPSMQVSRQGWIAKLSSLSLSSPGFLVYLGFS